MKKSIQNLKCYIELKLGKETSFMNKQFVDEWLNTLKDYWFNNDNLEYIYFQSWRMKDE